MNPNWQNLISINSDIQSVFINNHISRKVAKTQSEVYISSLRLGDFARKQTYLGFLF
jgi:hypothetical protein